MGLRFYIDADLLGVAKILATVRSDVTFPGDPGGLGADGVVIHAMGLRDAFHGLLHDREEEE
jgi:hypothetical protein